MNMQRRQWLTAMAALLCHSVPAASASANTPSVQPAWNASAPPVPDVRLLDHRGEPVALRPLLLQGPVAVNFFYTGCTSFCPPQTAIFRQLQALLGQEPAVNATLISLSIDPLGDSPEAVARFAAQYEARLGAQARWWMLTGSARHMQDIQGVLRAFDVHAASLAEHPAQVWIGHAARSRWLHSLGLASAEDMHRWLRAAAA
ncbi:hypothetical protein SDC9_153096 [bioreactor metagenome]|uniref:Thioredoxin domain-containing protein n=1 Tax=bioreactor metagenome TaxID=1076179 RepID=A0A645EX76_9ZZZZ